MNETEWLTSSQPKQMLALLGNDASPRKLRLFAVACCHSISRILAELDDHEAIAALRIAEQFADDQASDDERQDACQRLLGRGIGADDYIENWEAWLDASAAIGFACASDALSAASQASRYSSIAGMENDVPNPTYSVDWSDDEQLTDEAKTYCENQLFHQAAILRCMFGNPFGSFVFENQWRSTRVSQIADELYSTKRFDDMSLLGDALTAAGCENRDLLAHCKDPISHCRGCWVLDMALAKT